MTKIIRNLLIVFGAFWLSLWTVVPFDWLFGKLHIVYTVNVPEMILMGMMTSMGRAISALFACAIVTLFAYGRKSERWAFVVAAVYVIEALIRYGSWHVPPTIADRVWLATDRVFPSITCILGALVAAHFRNPGSESRQVE